MKPSSINPVDNIMPLYARILRVMRQRIHEGVWTVNTQIPTIEHLMAEFGAARTTIRTAIRELVDEGLLSSKRGRGTMVLPNVPPSKYVHHLIPAARPDDLTVKVLDLQMTSDLPRSSVAKGEQVGSYIGVRKIHKIDDAPLALGETYISTEIAESGLTINDLEDDFVIRIYKSDLVNKNIAIKYQLEVSIADTELSSLLEIGLGDPLVRVERKHIRRSDGLILYLSISSYPGSRIRLEISSDDEYARHLMQSREF